MCSSRWTLTLVQEGSKTTADCITFSCTQGRLGSLFPPIPLHGAESKVWLLWFLGMDLHKCVANIDIMFSFPQSNNGTEWYFYASVWRWLCCCHFLPPDSVLCICCCTWVMMRLKTWQNRQDLSFVFHILLVALAVAGLGVLLWNAEPSGAHLNLCSLFNLHLSTPDLRIIASYSFFSPLKLPSPLLLQFLASSESCCNNYFFFGACLFVLETEFLCVVLESLPPKW